MEARAQTLPTLIFLDENHLAATIIGALTSLGPKLKNHGYTSFYDEIPSSLTLDDVIKIQEAGLQAWDDQFPLFRQWLAIASELIQGGVRLNLTEKTNEKFKDTLGKDNPCAAIVADKATMTINAIIALLAYPGIAIESLNSENLISNLIEPYEPMLCFERHTAVICKDFYQSLRENKIRFQGTDLEDLINKWGNSFDKTATIEKQLVQAEQYIFDGIEERNKIMIDHYLRASESIFGRIGILHAAGFQELLLKNMTQEEANAKYTFVYLYRSSNPPITPLMSQLKNGESPLPLKVICIDITFYDEEILDEVLNKILSAQKTVVKENTQPAAATLFSQRLHTTTPMQDEAQEEQRSAASPR